MSNLPARRNRQNASVIPRDRIRRGGILQSNVDVSLNLQRQSVELMQTMITNQERIISLLTNNNNNNIQ